jgi:organic hydroperoxide reductase OsmC/OhrA
MKQKENQTMKGQHFYNITVKWTGNKGTGTDHYKNYGRSHTISIAGKADVLGSSDPAFRGDKNRHNPEELLVASLSACHMLWYLHLCAESGVVVIDYTDNATGTMTESGPLGGYFQEVVLNPIVKIKDKLMYDKAIAIHETANKLCFIANSVKFPVKHHPVIELSQVNISLQT